MTQKTCSRPSCNRAALDNRKMCQVHTVKAREAQHRKRGLQNATHHERTLSKRINRKMAVEGGQLLRHKMIEGRAQWWVVTRENRFIAAGNLTELAKTLGVTAEEPKTMEKHDTKGYVNYKQAVKISGYSYWWVRKAATDGHVKTIQLNKRKMLYSREDLENHVAKCQTNGAPPPRGRIARRRRSTLGPPVERGGDRLARCLKRWEGTPMEMTRDQFIERAIDKALDKLEA